LFAGFGETAFATGGFNIIDSAEKLMRSFGGDATGRGIIEGSEHIFYMENVINKNKEKMVLCY
jgi:hypothetical protein